MTMLAIVSGILAMLVILACIGWRQRQANDREADRLREKVRTLLDERQRHDTFNVKEWMRRGRIEHQAEIARQALQRAGLDEFTVSILDVDGGPRLAITTPECLTPERSRRLMAAFDVAFDGEGEVRYSLPVRPQVH